MGIAKLEETGQAHTFTTIAGGISEIWVWLPNASAGLLCDQLRVNFGMQVPKCSIPSSLSFASPHLIASMVPVT
jgi:hypothetical protein